MPLDPDFKARWIEALRGDYEQTTGCLRDEGGFCCLGVAVNTVDPEAWDEVQNQWAEFVYKFPTGEKSAAEWPEGFRVSVGLDTGDMDILTGMNDNGCTFPEIADYIEEYL